MSVDAEKTFDKIKHPFMVNITKQKTLSKAETEGNFPNLIQTIYKNLQLSSYLMVRNTKLSL